jgi:hypothetical protein
MRKALFNPLDIKKWFVVGFTAFLSGLTDCSGGSGSGTKSRGDVDWDTVIYFPQRAWEWLAENPVWAMAIAVAAFFFLVFLVLCTWWSSRGKFMFLDNVVHDKAQVIAPWHEFRTEGNSLFVWSLSVGVVFMAVLVWYIVECFVTIQGLYEVADNIRMLIGPVLMMALGFFCIMIIGGFVDMVLYDFVVPVMYRDRVTTVKAMQKFFPLLTSQFFYFIGYGLFSLAIIIAVVIGIVVAGLLTCCIGFLLLAIPYISAVVLLPVSYTMRAFSVEFLEQFGPEFHIFPKPVSTPPTTETTVA